MVTVEIRLSLRRNAAQTTTTVHFDWSLLKNRDIRDKSTLTLRNKFDALQEISETPTPKDEYKKVGWLFWLYGISTFVGYLTPNSVICICIQPKISERILSW